MSNQDNINAAWLNQRVGTAYVVLELEGIAFSELHDKCVERAMENIKFYRPDVDVEQHRAYVENRVQALINMAVTALNTEERGRNNA